MEKERWYSFNIKDALERLKTSPKGLNSHEAKSRLAHFGLNALAKEKKTSEILRFLAQFQNPLVYLLIVAAIITYFLHHNLDTSIILVIVFANAIIGYVQEKKAENALLALKKLMALKSLVIRGNEKIEISALELVPGDIIILDEGMKVPADIRLIEVQDLEVDESILTGESVPVQKNLIPLNDNTSLADQHNMVFSGTIISTGHGLGVVAQTGTNTELAKIAAEVGNIREETTPLNIQLNKLSKVILIITIVFSVIIFLIGILRGFDIVQMFLTAVAAAVSIIPEGLPAIISVALAIGVYKMSKEKAIVRKLAAVETLGAITTIASDKTGTLTYNEMTLEKIYVDSKLLEVTGKGYEPKGDFLIDDKIIDKKNPTLQKTFLASLLCNNATLMKDKDEWKILGDPTEGALLVAADKAGLHQEEIIEKHPRLDEIPFDAKNQFMATLNKNKLEDKNILSIKGTLEKILNLSNFIYRNGKAIRLIAPKKKIIMAKANELSRSGYRILALAYSNEPKSKTKISVGEVKNLTFLGFVGLSDPLRADAIAAIKKCAQAGIRVIMITGDHPETAKAIGQKLGIANEESLIITGAQVDLATKSQIKAYAQNAPIFARTTPEAKLKIVKVLRDQGEIIAVTGDGVNDAPILKFADVGVAMGIGGTDVAREAADVVLLNNNFATIVKAIEEGRTIFQNIRRVVFFLISTNAGEGLVLFISLMLGFPLPLIPVQILWINLITDGVSGFTVSMEPKTKEVLLLKPRPKKEGIINNIILWRIILVASIMTIGTLILYYLELKSGASIDKARTVAFTTMTLFQVFNVLNTRSMQNSIFSLKPFSNLYLALGFILMTILTVATSQLELLRTLFHTVQLDINEWIKIVLVCLSVVVVVEIEKLIRNALKTRY